MSNNNNQNTWQVQQNGISIKNYQQTMENDYINTQNSKTQNQQQNIQQLSQSLQQQIQQNNNSFSNNSAKNSNLDISNIDIDENQQQLIKNNSQDGPFPDFDIPAEHNNGLTNNNVDNLILNSCVFIKDVAKIQNQQQTPIINNLDELQPENDIFENTSSQQQPIQNSHHSDIDVHRVSITQQESILKIDSPLNIKNGFLMCKQQNKFCNQHPAVFTGCSKKNEQVSCTQKKEIDKLINFEPQISQKEEIQQTIQQNIVAQQQENIQQQQLQVNDKNDRQIEIIQQKQTEIKQDFEIYMDDGPCQAQISNDQQQVKHQQSDEQNNDSVHENFNQQTSDLKISNAKDELEAIMQMSQVEQQNYDNQKKHIQKQQLKNQQKNDQLQEIQNIQESNNIFQFQNVIHQQQNETQIILNNEIEKVKQEKQVLIEQLNQQKELNRCKKQQKKVQILEKEIQLIKEQEKLNDISVHQNFEQMGISEIDLKKQYSDKKQKIMKKIYGNQFVYLQQYAELDNQQKRDMAIMDNSQKKIIKIATSQLVLKLEAVGFSLLFPDENVVIKSIYVCPLRMEESVMTELIHDEVIFYTSYCKLLIVKKDNRYLISNTNKTVIQKIVDYLREKRFFVEEYNK